MSLKRTLSLHLNLLGQVPPQEPMVNYFEFLQYWLPFHHHQLPGCAAVRRPGGNRAGPERFQPFVTGKNLLPVRDCRHLPVGGRDQGPGPF